MGGQGVVKAYSKLEDGARPYVEKAVLGGKKLWAEGGSKVREGARWLEREHGDTLKSLGDTLRTSFLTLWAMIKGLLLVLWAALLQIFKALEPQLSAAWEASKPFSHQLGRIIIDYSLAVFRWLQENFPGYVLWAQDTGAALVQALEPQLSAAWEASKAFFHQLGKIIIDYSLAVFRWLQENFPGYVLWAQDTGAAL